MTADKSAKPEGGRFGRTPYRSDDLKEIYGTVDSGRLDVTCPNCQKQWYPSSKCCVSRYAGSPFCPECGADFRKSHLDFETEWPIGVGAVLYRGAADSGHPARRNLWHVTARYEDVDTGDKLLKIWDGTHTRKEYVPAEAVQEEFTPAGWTMMPGEKPLYHLTRNVGVFDAGDIMVVERCKSDGA